MRPSMKQIWMDLAFLFAKRSTCVRLQVGTVIVSEDQKTLISYGYNGNYAGGPNECDSAEAGNCGCIHAEANALNKPRAKENMIMYCTDSPCLNCAKLIINAGNIKKVIYNDEYRIKDGINLLKEAGIGAEKYDA